MQFTIHLILNRVIWEDFVMQLLETKINVKKLLEGEREKTKCIIYSYNVL